MTDSRDKKPDSPLDDPLGDDILGELEEWDKMFDNLHEADDQALGALIPAEEEAPARAPAPAAESEQPAAAEKAAQQEPAPAESHEEGPFQPPQELDFDEVRVEALGELLGSGPVEEEESPEGGASGKREESDSGLFTSASRVTIEPPAPRPEAGPRKGPAIVRRKDLERRRRERVGAPATGQRAPSPKRPEEVDEFAAAVDEFGKEEITNVESEELLSKMAESAEAFFAEQPPEVEFQVDDDFYDGIEVDESDAPETGQEAVEEEPVFEPPAGVPPRGRRTTAHIVRRSRADEAGAASEPVAKPVFSPVEEPSIPEGVAAQSEGYDLDIDLGDLDDAPAEEFHHASTAPGTQAIPPELTRPPAQELPDLAPPKEPVEDREAGAVPEPVSDDVDLDAGAVPEPVPESAPALGSVPTPAAQDASGKAIPGSLPEFEGAEGVDIDLAVDVAIDQAIQLQDREVEAAVEDATALDEGSLDPVDIAPELPPSKFAAAEPELDLEALALGEAPEAEPPEADEGSLAGELAVYERELLLQGDASGGVRLRVEAGRLAEKLGDLDRARAHYDEALALEPRFAPALRALRRVERQLGNWSEVAALLDAELAGASERERRALAAYRADVLMAIGEQDLARVSIGELIDDAPRDARALMANLELAYVDGRDEEFSDSLERLARVVTDSRLGAALHLCRAHLAEKAGEPAGEAYRAAAECSPGARGAATGLASSAARDKEPAQAAEALAPLCSDPQQLEKEPTYAGALEWRRASFLAAAGQAEEERAALSRAAGLCLEEPAILERLAEATERDGSAGEAAALFARLARCAHTSAERAAAFRRAARLWAGPASSPIEAAEALRRAVAEDPTDAAAAAELEEVLESTGAVDALVELDRQAAAADPGGGGVERERAARRLLAAERPEEAADELEKHAAPEAPAMGAALARVQGRAGRLAARAETLATMARAAPAHLDPAIAGARAARAFERLARQSGEEDPQPHWERAAAYWRKVLELSPDSTGALLSALRAAERAGGTSMPELLGAAPPSLTPVRVTELALARADLSLESDPSAETELEILREAHAGAPDDPRLCARLCSRLAALGRWEEAASVLLERAGSLGDAQEAPRIHYRAAAMLLDKTDEVGRAAELLAPVVEAHPEFSAASDLLQSAHRRLGQSSAMAPDQAGKAVLARQAPGDAFAALVRDAERAEAYGDPTAAVELYGKALELREGDPLARLGLARAAAAAGESAALADLALADLKRAEKRGDASAKADAYEELARIDAELRGDPASALVAWRSAADADPQRIPTLRQLEKAYLTADRRRELRDLYGRLVDALGEVPEAVPLMLERARLSDLVNLRSEEVLADYRSAFQRDSSCRAALFHLESQARLQGPSEELASLERATSSFFEDDARARAAFLTRCGETLGQLDELEGAITNFRAAAEVLPGYAPALSGWREVAIAGELWAEVADVTLGEAEVASSDADRARLYHLAAVALMDRAYDEDRAIEALRRALAADPAHQDAYVRLRIIYDQLGREEDLAQLLATRLEIEGDPAAKIELHHALARIHRDFLDDRETALEHLKAVLAIDADNLRAIAALSDIAWEIGAWADAADMLISRARLERDPDVLKGIFFRLGTIYADHLPDPRWAIKSFQKVLSYDPNDPDSLERIADLALETRDWKLALGACEQLVKLDPPPEEKIAHLHRVARVYREGFGDSSRAERAYRIALDLDLTNQVAFESLISFYEEAGDSRSMKVHFDRVAASMRNRLKTNPGDLDAYRVLFRVMGEEQRTGVRRGSRPLARAAAEILQLFGAAGEAEQALLVKEQKRPRIVGLGTNEADELLFPQAVSPALREIFRLLGDRIAKHIGVDVRRYGVGRAERLRKGSDPVAAIILEVAEELGLSDVDIYVSDKQPSVIAAEPTNPVSIILGSALATADRPAQVRFVAGRAVRLARASLAVPARMHPDEFGVLLAGLLRQFQPEFVPPGLDEDEVAAEQQRLRRLIPSGMRDELGPYALGIAGVGFDHRRIWAGILEAGNRAGLICSGSTAASLAVLARLGGYRDFQGSVDDWFVANLMRFAVSEDHMQLRALTRG